MPSNLQNLSDEELDRMIAEKTAQKPNNYLASLSDNDLDRMIAEKTAPPRPTSVSKPNIVDNFGQALKSITIPMEDLTLGAANYQDWINTEAEKRLNEMSPQKPPRPKGEGVLGGIRDTLASVNNTVDKGIGGFGTKFLNTVTFGQSPKVLAAFETPFSDNTYRENVDIQKAMDKIRQGESPIASMMGGLAGNVAQYGAGASLVGKALPFLASSGSGMTASNVAKNVGRGAIANTLIGQGQGHGTDALLEDAALGAAGEAVGPALNLAGQGVKKVASPIKDIILNKIPGVANWIQKRADKKVLALVDDLANQYQSENLSKAGRGFQEGVEQAQNAVEGKYQEIKRPIMEKFGGKKVSPKKFRESLKSVLADENAVTPSGQIKSSAPIFKGENSGIYNEVAAYVDDASQPMTLREMEQYFQPWYRKAKFSKLERTTPEEVYGDMYTRAKNAYLDEVDALLQEASTPQKSAFVRPEGPREFIPTEKSKAAFSYRPKAEPFNVKTTVRNVPLEYQAERAIQPVPETEVLRDEVARALRVPDSLLPNVQKPTLRVPESLLPREQVGFTTNLQQVEKVAQEYPEFARATAQGDLITGNADEIKAATDALYTPRMISTSEDVMKAQAEAEALMNSFRAGRQEYAQNQGVISRLMKLAAKDPEKAVQGAITNLPGSFIEEALALNPAYQAPLQKAIVGNLKNTIAEGGTKQPTGVLAKIMKDYRSESEPLKQLLGEDSFNAILKVLGERVPKKFKPSLLPSDLKERIAAYGSQSAIRSMLESLGVGQGN